ncbi:hypothetical protein H9X96_11265 [Pedobacter sp. N36a]|uniref:hypothetical protein n=1 Tax=Pedobacter sp. N36a TaxID=2767996 RepID=UPI001656A98B|nr:hypothetical protein [Pedobacter sp. N36a]MBC8986356.1 hypothetical protein [Pedobacter sp. N36a]
MGFDGVAKDIYSFRNAVGLRIRAEGSYCEKQEGESFNFPIDSSFVCLNKVQRLLENFAIASVDFRLSEKDRAYARPDIPLLQRPILSLLGYHFEKKEEQLTLRYYKVNENGIHIIITWLPAIKLGHASRKSMVNCLSLLSYLFLSSMAQVPAFRINFDLEDCDNILRVEDGNIQINKIISSLKKLSIPVKKCPFTGVVNKCSYC